MEPDPTPPLRNLMVKDVLRAAAQYFAISRDQLLGQQKARDLTRARHLAMHLAYEHAGASILKIGRVFKKDHTTVLYAVRKMRADASIAADAEKIMELADQMRRWTDQELAEALKMRAERVPMTKIAEKLDRTEESVRNKFDAASGAKARRRQAAKERKALEAIRPIELPPDFTPRIVEERGGQKMVEFYPGHITAEKNLPYFGVRL